MSDPTAAVLDIDGTLIGDFAKALDDTPSPDDIAAWH